jgi:hypothetical protein
MAKLLFNVDDANDLINRGAKLVFAGSHKLLQSLEEGNWIGGSTYYCTSAGKGIADKDFLFVQEIPDYCKEIKIKYYNIASLKNIYQDMYDNGFSIILIPFESKTHFKYPIEVVNYPLFATKPLIGWIAAASLNDKKKLKPSVCDGQNKGFYDDGAVVMHVKLPENKLADLKVVNMFELTYGQVLEFKEEGFNIKNVIVSDREYNFVDYLKENNIDIRFPLVGALAGTIPTIVSFKEIDEKEKVVRLYAPLYKKIQYKLAKAEGNYYDMLIKNIQEENNFILPVICILHFLYGDLANKISHEIPDAPTTFGEIAHILVNQTLTYLSIYDI